VSSWQQSPTGMNPQPYAPSGVPPFSPQPPAKSNAWLWVLLGIGGVLFLCCGGGVVGLAVFGMNIAAEEVSDQVRDNPKFREHIGELQSMETDWVATAAKNDDETFVYNARGDKGSGVLTVKEETDDDWNSIVVEASLRLPDGTQVPIIP
jgi:hypothetical protein